VAGCLYYISSTVLVYLEIDDVVDAIPVHMVNGVWGLIAAGLFATKENYSESYSGLSDFSPLSPHIFCRYSDGSSRADHCAGIFYGGSGYQLASNICFILTIISWCGSLSLINYFVIDAVLGMDCFERSRKARESIGYGDANDIDVENEGL
jgi:ammonium transporter, Amt family